MPFSIVILKSASIVESVLSKVIMIFGADGSPTHSNFTSEFGTFGSNLSSGGASHLLGSSSFNVLSKGVN